jgi:ABC-type transport system involved in cytochrome bd biosynthesis fused ATPase/permease subunit
VSTEQATSHAIDATLAATGSKATYTGAGMTIGSWFLSSEFGVLMGVFIGVLGLGVQWYYKHKLTKLEVHLRQKEDARRQAEHEQRMGMYQ